MSTQVRFAIYRFVALLIAVGGGDAIIQFLGSPNYDWRHLGVVLGADVVLAIEEYYKSGQLLRDLGLSPGDVGTSNPAAPPQSPVVTKPPASA